ncbi:MAG: NAD-dependent deacetylase [Acidobacteria bacterium]|nr:NAD-dependent deacetylase [Acidobacteriota bacterium]
MGVDSGLPDFRGPEGFWDTYPPFAKLGLSFVDLANPRWFASDPGLAWGFYGHRLHLYRTTIPHRGFDILRRFAGTKSHGAFVFTSNVDGQFQEAGFAGDRIVECHGSIHHLQCCTPCHSGLWSAAEIEVTVDPETMRARPPLPACPACGGLARPNILMFGDWSWIASRTVAQEERLDAWLDAAAGAAMAVIEIGAGTAVPTVRMLSRRVAMRPHARLIRINPREPEVPPGHISIPLKALDALLQLERRYLDRAG